MAKIFEVDYRSRSLRDTVSNLYPTAVNNIELLNDDKGTTLRTTPGAISNIQYTTPTSLISSSTFYLATWVKRLKDSDYNYLWYSRLDASHYMNIFFHSAGNFFIWSEGGTGLQQTNFNGVPVGSWMFLEVLNNLTTNKCNVFINGVQKSDRPAHLFGCSNTFFPAGSLSGVVQNTLIVKTIMRNDIPSASERDALYQDFLNSTGSITTPNILRPRIEVDPKGTSVCYDFQQYRGGNTVLDLSGNGNHGTGTTGNQPVENGVVCDNVSAGFTVTVPNMSVTHATAFTLEMMLRSDSLAVATPFLTFGGGYTSGIRLFTVSNTCQTQIGKAGAPTTVIDNVNSSQHEMHYVLTYSDGSFITYINGVKRTTTALPMIWASNIATPLGGFGGVPQKRLTGKFFSVYPRALTEAEIKTKYNKIARTIDLQVMDDNLLCDQKAYTSGQFVKV